MTILLQNTLEWEALCGEQREENQNSHRGCVFSNRSWQFRFCYIKQIARGLSRGKRCRHTKLYLPAVIDYHGLYAIERCADRFFLEKDLAGDGIAICSRVWHIACHTQ